MSEKFDQLKIMQEMFPNATFVDANGERVADTSKTLDHIAGVSKKVSLTEQWKEGKLDRNKLYYYETPFMTTDSASGFWLSNTLDKEKDKVKILSKVPSYEEWQQMKAFCEEFNALEVSEENQQLKKLLTDICCELVDDEEDMTNGLLQYFNTDVIDRIKEALK